MAKILYGVLSVGMGHAIRSKVIIDHLKKKKHKVMIITSGRAYNYFKRYHNDVHNIEGLEIIFKKNAILNFKTAIANLRKLSRKTFEKLGDTRRAVEKFNPDIVFSDMESFSGYIANELNKPLININNQHFLIYGNYNCPDIYRLSKIKALMIIKTILFKAKYNLVMCLPGTHIENRQDSFQIKPIIRKEILDVKKTESRDYVFVYQSTKSYDKLIDILKRINYKFIIYGFDKDKVVGNLFFKKFNDGKDFLKDLVNCKAVITNGGFTLISESLYLGKPILVVPIKKHFEQVLNSLYIQEKKFGEFYTDLNENHVVDFIMNLKQYNYKLERWDNTQTFSLIDMLINKEKR